jgi:hypothetical protein
VNSRGAAPEAHDAAVQGVELDRADRQRFGPSTFMTTQEGVDPGKKDRVLKGFAQVVVGADVEPLHLVKLTLLRGQDHERRVDAGGAQILADAEAVSLRQHQVQHDDVVLAAQTFGESGLTVTAQLYRETFILDEVSDRSSKVVVIFDDQHTATFFTHCK